MQFILVLQIAGDPALFINGQRSLARSHPEDRSCLCRFQPCNEVLVRLCEIFKPGKKQDLTPLMTLKELKG